ncbi:hypothetical protein E2562_030842 [Oryza meyeriana var. granulata]|uniref:Uncharacterized protein n=1 Tax=Oryza meyeriana var. granulata TaxID=110450 RepID=A0A6G1EZV8_9ORYZ|nr:hypothetical protein E2562_030842 [Oryza meyeriana var. granulata]
MDIAPEDITLYRWEDIFRYFVQHIYNLNSTVIFLLQLFTGPPPPPSTLTLPDGSRDLAASSPSSTRLQLELQVARRSASPDPRINFAYGMSFKKRISSDGNNNFSADVFQKSYQKNRRLQIKMNMATAAHDKIS